MVSINDYKTLNIELDQVNSYIPPIVVNEADNNGRRLKFTPTYEGQPVTGITSARMYYDPRPRDASSIGDYVDGTKDGDGWVFVIPPNTFTANVQGIASVSFTDKDGETYTRSMPIDVESGGTKIDSQGTRIDRLIATLEQMVNDFTMSADAKNGPAGSQASVNVTRLSNGSYNLDFTIPTGEKGPKGDPGDLTTVAHDDTLTGDGTSGTPLSVALEIGGTNLIKGSKPYGKSGFFEHFNSVTDNEYGEVTLQSTTTSESYPKVHLDYSDTFTFDKTDIVTGDKYVISYDIMMLERTYTASSTFTGDWIGIRHNGGNWSGLIRYNGIKDDFLNAPLNEWAHFEHSVTANAWDGTTNIQSAIELGTKSVGKFRFRMRNVKLEKGTKATAWSPAPEDFDGKYTSKTELEQKINSFKTTVSETYTTKTDFTNLNNAATKTYQFHANIGQTGWYKLGTWSRTEQSDVCVITIYAGEGQNGKPYQNREVRVFIKDGFQPTESASGAFGVTIDRIRNADNAEVQVRATAADSCDVWYKGDTTYAAGRYTISIDPSSKWTHSGSFTASAPSSGTLQTQEYQTYSTKSYVDHTLSNYVPLSTYQALEARVQALEAKLANK